MSLHTTLVGHTRPDALFLHGLFGQGKNWTSIARALEPIATSLLMDLPNHGRSPWTDDFSYVALADEVAADVAARLGSAGRLTVVGHSMGGKVAMVMALRHPEIVKGLVVVDIAPDSSSHGYGFSSIVTALQSLQLGHLHHRSEASKALKPDIEDARVRSFLLQNLRRRRDAGGFAWRFNLELLAESLPTISGWPEGVGGRYDGPVLWIRGSRSEYVRPEHYATMMRLFPNTALLTVEDAGHWVHSEQPDAVIDGLRNFLLAERLVPEAAP